MRFSKCRLSKFLDSRLAGGLLLAMLLSPTRLWAYPTSNNYIPTADILEPGHARIELENDAFTRPFNKEKSQNYLLTQWGVNKRLEVGVDAYDFSNDTAYALNAKFLAVTESKKRPALALGVADVAEGLRPTTYAVATKSWGSARGHVGALHNAGDTFVMAGTDYKVNDNLYLLADWTTGTNGYLTGGIYQRLCGELWFNIGAGRPNSSANRNLLLLNLGYTFKFK